jgi:hypothetical protein
VGVSTHKVSFSFHKTCFCRYFYQSFGTIELTQYCLCDRESSSPEMHGTITGVFKNQIDWIPLNTGSVRPTQGKTWYVSSKYVYIMALVLRVVL